LPEDSRIQPKSVAILILIFSFNIILFLSNGAIVSKEVIVNKVVLKKEMNEYM
jgi:hypothetical protein